MTDRLSIRTTPTSGTPFTKTPEPETTSDSNESEQNYPFHKKVSELIAFIINDRSLEKNIFLADLLLNSCKALDEIRYEHLMDRTMPDRDIRLCINIDLNENDRILSITDTGTGMTKINLLHSFGARLTSANKIVKNIFQCEIDVSILNRFGIGFYSVYLVADIVTVITKSSADKQYAWESRADGYFTIKRDVGAPLRRGTKVILHIKEDCLEYIEESNIRKVIDKFIEANPEQYPIEFNVLRRCEKRLREDETETEEIEKKNRKKELSSDKKLEKENNQIKEIIIKEYTEEHSEEKYTEEHIKEEYTENDVFNRTRFTNRGKNFIKVNDLCRLLLSNYRRNNLFTRSFRVKGQFEYTGILLIPYYIDYDESEKKRSSINILLKNTIVYEKLPSYLCFIRVIIYCHTRLSRDNNARLIRFIRDSFVERCLDFFNTIAHDSELCESFYDRYGKNIQQGIQEDSANYSTLVKLLRFHTSTFDAVWCSLEDYVSRMKKDQEYIYFVAGENENQVANSPFTESLRKRGIEVIYMIEPVISQKLEMFKGRELMSVANEKLVLPEDDDEKKRAGNKGKFQPLCMIMEIILRRQVQSVQISNRLVESPCCVVISQDIRTTEIKTEDGNAWITSAFSAVQRATTKSIVEINPDHIIIKYLRKKMNAGKICEDSFIDLVNVLYGTALLVASPHGSTLDDIQKHANHIYSLIVWGTEMERLCHVLQTKEHEEHEEHEHEEIDTHTRN